VDYSAIKQLLDAVDDKDKVKIGIELAKWLAGKGWEMLTNREKKSAAKAAQSVIQLATMDDVREFSPTYQAVSRHTGSANRAAPFMESRGSALTKRSASTKRARAKKAAAKKSAVKKTTMKRSASKKIAAKRSR
jgi:hypothetical protein